MYPEPRGFSIEEAALRPLIHVPILTGVPILGAVHLDDNHDPYPAEADHDIPPRKWRRRKSVRYRPGADVPYIFRIIWPA